MSGENTIDAIDLVDKDELDAMSPEEQTEFFKQIDQSKHAYVNNALAEIFKDVKKSAEFVETIAALAKEHVSLIDGTKYVPKFADVIYNLCVYSACALERLSFGEPYRTHWVDPVTFNPTIGSTYLVMLSCGFIAEATVDTMDTANLMIVLNDSTTRINKNRLLAINSFVTDANDFLRGTPKIGFDALTKIESGVEEYIAKPAMEQIKRQVESKKAYLNIDRNRAKRARKKK